jgi:hypothetical protein
MRLFFTDEVLRRVDVREQRYLFVVRIDRQRGRFLCRNIKIKPFAAGVAYDARDSTVGCDISARQSIISDVVALEIQHGIIRPRRIVNASVYRVSVFTGRVYLSGEAAV